jgi:hypothetical protein
MKLTKKDNNPTSNNIIVITRAHIFVITWIQGGPPRVYAGLQYNHVFKLS